MSVLFVVAVLWPFICARGGDARPIVLSRLARVDLPVTLAGMYLGPLALGLIPLVLWCPLQLLGAVALFRRHRDRVWAIAILIGLPLLVITLLIRSTLDFVAYRYVLGIFPLACIVAAVSWKAVPLRPVLAKTCFGVAALAYCLTGAVFIARAGPDAFGYQDWRSASQYLNRQSTAGSGKQVQEVVTAIEQQDLSVCQMAHFLRVTFFAVRAQPCPPASPSAFR